MPTTSSRFLLILFITAWESASTNRNKSFLLYFPKHSTGHLCYTWMLKHLPVLMAAYMIKSDKVCSQDCLWRNVLQCTTLKIQVFIAAEDDTNPFLNFKNEDSRPVYFIEETCMNAYQLWVCFSLHCWVKIEKLVWHAEMELHCKGKATFPTYIIQE